MALRCDSSDQALTAGAPISSLLPSGLTGIAGSVQLPQPCMQIRHLFVVHLLCQDSFFNARAIQLQVLM